MSDEHEFKILNDEGDVLCRLVIPARVPVEVRPADPVKPNGERWSCFTPDELHTIAIGLLNQNTARGDGLYASIRAELEWRGRVNRRRRP